MNFCQYCHATVDYGYLCDVCRDSVTCDKNNLCIACKKFIAERIVQVEREAQEIATKTPGWLRRGATG